MLLVLVLFYEKRFPKFTLQKQSFAGVSEISNFKNLAKPTQKAVLEFLFDKVTGPHTGSLLKKTPA